MCDPDSSCCHGCRNCCKEEFRLSNFLLDYDRPQDFVHFQFGQSFAYLVWRVVWPIYHVTWIVVSVLRIREWISPDVVFVKWLIYQTYWCYLMLTLSTATDLACVIYINIWRKDIRQGLRSTCPWYLKANWMICNMGNACSLTVTFQYWILLYAITPYPPVDGWLLNLVLHAFNSIYVIINLLVIAAPVRILHFWYTVVFSVVYFLFTLIYQLAGGTNAVGGPGIYPSIDWEGAPGNAVGFSILQAVVLPPVMQCLCYGIYRLRRVICCCAEDKERLALADHDNPSYTEEKVNQ